MLWLVLLGVTVAAGTIAIADDDDADNAETSGSSEGLDGEPNPRGTDLADDLIGSSEDDSIFAFEGNDLVEGRDGDDRIFGHDGEDALSGGQGDDFIRGGNDDDVILDHEGSDTIFGDAGDDTIISTSAVDGEELARVARGIAAGEAVTLDTLNSLYSFDEDTDDEGDTIHGGRGNDAIIAGDGDVVELGAGNDTVGVGDWMQPGADAVRITDFNVNEDTLVFSHDGEGAIPRLSVQYLGGDTGEALLFANNELIARVEGAGTRFTLSDVNIVERSGGPLF